MSIEKPYRLRFIKAFGNYLPGEAVIVLTDELAGKLIRKGVAEFEDDDEESDMGILIGASDAARPE